MSTDRAAAGQLLGKELVDCGCKPSPWGPATPHRLVLPFSAIGLADVPEVGGKNASLGEMAGPLAAAGVPVPDGFATTAAGYRLFLERAWLEQTIAEILGGLAVEDLPDLARRGQQVRRLILGAELPPELVAAILAAYR